MLLANLPGANLMADPVYNSAGKLQQAGGLIYYLYQGVKLGIYPSIIFMGVGAMTDFGPLIANPKSMLLGAAAQLGIFVAYLLALATGLFTQAQASAIGIIGGADGPTAIYVATKLAPELLGRNSDSGIFIYGACSGNSTADNEASDHQERTRYCYAAVA